MMTESQILVFSECGVTRMRSAGDSNEDSGLAGSRNLKEAVCIEEQRIVYTQWL